MGLEIERKFLINQIKILEYAVTHDRIRQGYLSLDIDRTVRVRMHGDKAWLTVKGRNDGAVRKEFEYSIPEQDGNELLEMCVGGSIDKVRYLIPFNDLTIEVDVFNGDNVGLVVAEIEFEEGDDRATLSVQEIREHLPHWIGHEVTNDIRYYNSNLLTYPYNYWNK